MYLHTRMLKLVHMLSITVVNHNILTLNTVTFLFFLYFGEKNESIIMELEVNASQSF